MKPQEKVATVHVAGAHILHALDLLREVAPSHAVSQVERALFAVTVVFIELKKQVPS